jgi:ABC-type bacteriocin/lantibiotic exporter with double-glycine peptidase domain
MDDPISALDTRVSKYIIKFCIQKHLKNKLRILATHRLDVLKYSD